MAPRRSGGGDGGTMCTLRLIGMEAASSGDAPGMRQSTVTLPPLVEGPVRGLLRLQLGPVSWIAGRTPAGLDGPLQARIVWWGDSSGGEMLALPGNNGGGSGGGGAFADTSQRQKASVAFQLRTGPKYLTRYLHDMGTLDIAVEAAVPRNGHPAAAATASVGLLALNVQAPLSGSYPVMLAAAVIPAAVLGADSSPAIVGSLPVRLDLDYGSGGKDMGTGAMALLSSFELNEHLASSAAAGRTAGGIGAVAAPSTCTELVAALQDRGVVAAAWEQVAPGSEIMKQPHLERLLSLLLPAANQHELEYAAAMLLPFGGTAEQPEQPSMSLEDLQAAAAACSDVECRLQQQQPAEATRCLRQLAAALCSRSLDLAAAFAAAEEQQLAYTELGALLRCMHPGASTEEARCLLALLTAAQDSRQAMTLPGIKAALALVLEAQQFPTSDDLERQHLAAAARHAKVVAAATAAAIAEQRAAAATATRAPSTQQQAGRERKKAVVSRLKSNQQLRRQSSSSGAGSTQQGEAPALAAGEPVMRVQAPCHVPAVVVGIPVLLPPPAPLVGHHSGAAPSGSGSLLVPGASCMAAPGQPPNPALAAPAGALPAEVPGLEAAPAASGAANGQTAGPPALSIPAPAPQAAASHHQQAQAQDPLLHLIQQAEQLKAALKQAAGTSSMVGHSSRGPSLLEHVAANRVAGPRLPNLLIPPKAAASTAGSSASAEAGAALAEAAADGSLSAATAALLAAAKMVRREGERELQRQQSCPGPGTWPSATVAQAAPGAAAVGPAGPSAVAAVAATAAAAAVAMDSSDAESDAEDALLESLFFTQQFQPPAAVQELAAAAMPAGGLAFLQQQSMAAKQEAQYVLRVQLQKLQLTEDDGCSRSVHCVVKAPSSGGQPQQLTLPVASHCTAGSAGRAAACHVEVLLAAAGAGRAPGKQQQQQQDGVPLPAYLFLELWRHSGSLLGVARVPLLQPSCLPGPRHAVVAEGQQAVHDILEGREAGSLYVAAVLQERGLPPLAAALRHCFAVHIRSAHRLPSAAAYASAGLRAPDARLLRYSFPGDSEVLQTKELACCSNPSFEAAAQHEMVLPAAQSILPLLQDGLLRFELFDCWADQPHMQRRQQHGWALLPLAELAGLVEGAKGGRKIGSNGGRETSRVMLLPLCTEYDSLAEVAAPATAAGGRGAAQRAAAAGAAARGPSLKIELRYKSQLCTMDAAEAAEAAAAADAEPSMPFALKQASSKGPSSCGCDSDGDNSRALANSSTSLHCSLSQAHRRQQPQAAPTSAAASGSLMAATSSQQAAAATVPAVAEPLPEPAEPSVPATLLVEIVRACGLAAAVREATAACANSDSSSSSEAVSSLSRAATVGPNAFARLALFAEEPKLQCETPPLQTPFVAQSFCPSWRAAHSYQLHLTGQGLEALATKSVLVEVWHRCSRAASAVAGGQREMLLGVGTAPLRDVLRKAQGLQCWVPLSPPGSSSSTVGAVQIAVRLSELGGLLVDSGSGHGAANFQLPEPLLLRCADAAALLPPPLRIALLLPPGAGWEGQAAVAVLQLDLLVPPSSSSNSRPKADRYYCRYSLPGSSGAITTAARVLTAVGSAGSVPSRNSGTNKSRKKQGPGEQQQQQLWGAKLNHRGFIEVQAGPALALSLLQAPLRVQVYKQAAAAAASSSGGGMGSAGPRGTRRPGMLVGNAELDLSPLLWTSSGSNQQEERCVSGCYPLVGGAAASQGGASLAATVQLQLLPAPSAAHQVAAAAATGADACFASWQLEVKGVEEEHRCQQEEGDVRSAGDGSDSEEEGAALQQHQHQQLPTNQQPRLAHACSSDDEDEQLLQRCRLLVAGSAGGNEASRCSNVLDPTGHQQQQSEQQPADADEPAAVHTAGSGDASQKQAQSQPPLQQAAENAAGSGDAASIICGDQNEQPQEPADVLEGSLVVQIETALHLPAAAPPAVATASSSSSLPSYDGYSAFVQAAWGQQRQVWQCTPAVPVHVAEAAALEGTAVWGAELELPAAAALWSAAAGSRPVLVLNVWTTVGAGGGSGGRATAAADSLIGHAVLDLSLLPVQGSLRGWFHIISSDQERRGQLKAAVWPDGALRHQLQQLAPPASLATMAPSAATAQQETATEVTAAPSPSAAAPAHWREQQDEGGPDLMGQLQSQLQELERLSHRLAAAPPAAGAAAATLVDQARSAPAAGAGAYELADSEGEEAAWPAFDARQVGHAWSGTDSDEDDPLALLGIAFEGAVSPGVCDHKEQGAEEEEGQSRHSQPALLLTDDWMFSISKTAAAGAGAAAERGTTGDGDAAEESGAAEDEAQQVQAQQLRRLVVFRNVIPGGTALPRNAGPLHPVPEPARPLPPPALHRSLALPVEAAAPVATAGDSSAAAAVVAPATEGAHATSGITMQPQPAPSLATDWMFEIRRARQAAASSGDYTQAATTLSAPLTSGAAGACGQFAPMQLQQQQQQGAPQGAELELLRQQLVEQQQQQQARPGSTAATIDQVLEQLRPRGGTTAPVPTAGGCTPNQYMQLPPSGAGPPADS